MDTTILGAASGPAPMEDSLLQVPDIKLTNAQQEAHDMLLSFLTGKISAPAAIFKGYAGVGKSFTLGVLIETVKRTMPGFSIGVAAPTHKAVKVLKKDSIKGVEYRTVHSWLKLKEQVNETTGVVYFAPDNAFKDEEPPVADLKILIIDEVSMLQDELFNYLVPFMKDGLKVIFTGDPAQIPPVKQQDCIPFRLGSQWGMVVLELTEIMRQKAGNPILSFATEIRNNYHEGDFQPIEDLNEANEGIKLLYPETPEEDAILRGYFTSREFKEDADYMKVIAWTNATVDKYNRIVRKMIYGSAIDKIMLGENLIMDKLYKASSRVNNMNLNVSISTNEELLVKKVQTSTKYITVSDMNNYLTTHTFKIYSAEVEYYTDRGVRRATLPIVHEEDEKAYQTLLDSLKKTALEAPKVFRGNMWKQYFKAVEAMAWVKYNYALTGHKSQGSSYTNCMVLKWDIDKNQNIEERNRILYVACTRARNRLYIQP